MGWHLSGLFSLIYALFPMFKTHSAYEMKTGPLHLGGVPLLDVLLMGLGVAAALYLGFAWQGVPWLGIEEQTFRMGNPNIYDMVFGCILIVLVLDIARRTLGRVLPAIICHFMAYALFGPIFPGILQHRGVKFRTFVSSMYFPQEGIFGVTLWVVSTIAFHFVLFGVIAQRTGLGQLFIDNATILAGRYTGGPAKVSVVSSAFFGTISGSSVANTVSTGALTIPNMKGLGYPGHFAGRVEVAASAGGQITPPIMGAAAFIMGGQVRRMAVQSLHRTEGEWLCRTDQGEVRAAKIVLAMGAWSARLLRPLGIRIPLEAERGYHVCFADPGITFTHSVMDAGMKFVASSMSDGLRVAGTAEFAGLDAPVNDKRLAGLIRLARRISPDLRAEAHTTWSGQRPSLPDSPPCIVVLEGVPGPIAAFGHSHYGLMMAPKTGELVADTATGRAANIDLSPYLTTRS